MVATSAFAKLKTNFSVSTWRCSGESVSISSIIDWRPIECMASISADGSSETVGSGRGEADAARPVEAAEVGHLRNDDVVGALLRVQDDDPGPVLVQRPLELVGRLQRRERRKHLSALEPDLEPYPIPASHPTPPP